MKRPQSAMPLRVGYLPMGWRIPISRRTVRTDTPQRVRENRIKAAIRRLKYKQEEL